MQIQQIPRTYVRVSLQAARLPVTAAEAVLSGQIRPERAWLRPHSQAAAATSTAPPSSSSRPPWPA